MVRVISGYFKRGGGGAGGGGAGGGVGWCMEMKKECFGGGAYGGGGWNIGRSGCFYGEDGSDGGFGEGDCACGDGGEWNIERGLVLQWML